MLIAYLSCLVAGGALVVLSTLGGDADADAHVDLDGGMDADVDGHLEADVGADADGHLGDHGHGGASDAVHGVRGGRAAKRRVWMPFTSMRFWVFSVAFFGLTGALLTALTSTEEPMTAVVSAITGVLIGTAVAGLAQALKKPVNVDAVSVRDLPGQIGELVMPLREGGTSRIRVKVRHRELELLAHAAEPAALPAGTRVAVLRLDEDGHAVIAPEESLFQR